MKDVFSVNFCTNYEGWVQANFFWHGYIIISLPFVEKNLSFLSLYQKSIDHTHGFIYSHYGQRTYFVWIVLFQNFKMHFMNHYVVLVNTPYALEKIRGLLCPCWFSVYLFYLLPRGYISWGNCCSSYYSDYNTQTFSLNLLRANILPPQIKHKSLTTTFGSLTLPFWFYTHHLYYIENPTSNIILSAFNCHMYFKWHKKGKKSILFTISVSLPLFTKHQGSPSYNFHEELRTSAFLLE